MPAGFVFLRHREEHGDELAKEAAMKTGASDYDRWLYSHTPSQAEGERDEPAERAAMQHPMSPGPNRPRRRASGGKTQPPINDR